MRARTTIELMKKYTVCPECGNDAIRNGEGTLEVTSDTFIRTCKCGWRVEVKEERPGSWQKGAKSDG